MHKKTALSIRVTLYKTLLDENHEPGQQGENIIEQYIIYPLAFGSEYQTRAYT